MLGRALLLAVALPAHWAQAGDWKTTLSLTGNATLTDNVNLSPPGQEQGDLYFVVTPAISMNREGDRLKASFTYAPSAAIYTSGTNNNQLYNTLNATANLTAVPDFFFIDAQAVVSQTFLSPFGALPTDLGTATDNRTQTYGLFLSPYIKGRFGSGGTYEFKNTTIWSGTDSSFTNSASYIGWVANASAPITETWAWTVEGTRATNNFAGDSQSQGLYSNAVRGLLTNIVNPELSLTLRGGYENNNYPGNQNTSGAIYGLGLTWTPNTRNSLTGYAEKRYFGTGYNFSFTHRHRMTSLVLYGSQDVTSYPQALFTVPPGDSRSLIDAALTSRIPDPVQRQQAVSQFMAITGTPSTLLVPNTFYSQQLNLVQTLGGSYSIIGARNSVILSALWLSNNPVSSISGQALPPQFGGLDSYVSYGGALNYSYRLTGHSNLDVLITDYFTEFQNQPDKNSNNKLARVQINTALSPKTTGSVGVRWQQLTSTVTSGYNEKAVFATVVHSF